MRRGRRSEKPKTLLVPTHDVWMAWAVARLGYRWCWVPCTAGRGCLSPMGQPNPQMQAYAYGPESAESQGQSAGGGGGMGGHVRKCQPLILTCLQPEKDLMNL